MHRPDVGKTAAGIHDGEFRAGIPLEEEQARVLFCGIGGFFFVGVDVVKDPLAR